MRPSRSTLAIGSAWILFWILMVAVAVQDYIRDGDGDAYWQPVLWECSSMLAATALLLAQNRHSARYRHLLDQPWRWFGLQARWLPVYWILFVPLAFGLRHAVYAMAGAVYEHEPWLDTFVYEALRITVFVGMFTAIRFGLLSYEALLQQKLQVEQSQALLRQAQLQTLSQQMQPHFLFNALNTVSSLMHVDVDRADAALTRLAAVLRGALDAGNAPAVPLETELRLARAYAGIMEERYADRVTLAWRIDDAALACPVPVMSLQTLLENVFKHVVERRRDTTHVEIRAQRADGALCLRIDDDGGVLDGAAGGLGLRNLRERIAVLHGSQATLTLAQRAPAGVRAEMRLPCAC